MYLRTFIINKIGVDFVSMPFFINSVILCFDMETIIFLKNNSGINKKPQYFIKRTLKLFSINKFFKFSYLYLLKCPTASSYFEKSSGMQGTFMIRKPSFLR